MRINRICKRLGALLIGILLLSSCSRLSEDVPSGPDKSQGTVSETEQTWEDLLNRSFPIDGLSGKSEQELVQSYPRAVYYTDYGMTGVLNTPTCLLMSHLPVPMVYEKTTGSFRLACRDPLCDHETCIWNQLETLLYYGEERLFFVKHEEHAIYMSDMDGEHPEKVYSNDGDLLSHLIQEGEYLYFTEESIDAQTEESNNRLLRVHLPTGRSELLLDLRTGFEFLPLNGTILYWDDQDSCIWQWNPDGERTKLWGEDVLPIASYQGWVYYSTAEGLFRAPVDALTDGQLVLSPARGETWFEQGHIFVAERTKIADGYQTQLFASELDGSNYTLIADFVTDGKPDAVDEVWSDGTMLYVNYQTEQDRRGDMRAKHASILCLATGEKFTWKVR